MGASLLALAKFIYYFYGTFNNKNFKMEVEQTNFVTVHIINYVKIWSNKFQMVMINCSKLCASS